MRNKALQTNIDSSDPTNYPNGRIKNNTGTGNGTPVSEQTKGDIHEFFDKALRDAGIAHNNLPDNETNGYQTLEAVRHIAGKNDIRQRVQVSGPNLLIPNIDLSRLLGGEIMIGFAQGNLTNLSTIKGKNASSKPVFFLDINEASIIPDGTWLAILYDSVQGIAISRFVLGYDFPNIASQYGIKSETALKANFHIEKNFGTFVAGRPGTLVVSSLATVTGDLSQVEVIANDAPNNFTTYRVTLANSMTVPYYPECVVINSNPALASINYALSMPVVNVRTATVFDILLKTSVALGVGNDLRVLIKTING